MSGGSIMSFLAKSEEYEPTAATFSSLFGKSSAAAKITNPTITYVDAQEEEAAKLQENIAAIESNRAVTEQSNLAAESDARAVTEEDRKKRLRRSVNIYTSGMGDTSKAKVSKGVLLGA